MKHFLIAAAAVFGLALPMTGGSAAGTIVGHWTFEGGRESAPDMSPLANDGVIFNGDSEPGFNGNAIAFNGDRAGGRDGRETSTYVLVGDPEDGSLDLEGDVWSIDLRLKTTDTELIAPVLAGKSYEGSAGYSMTLEAGHAAITLRDPEGDYVIAQSRAPVNDGDWHRIVVSRQGATLRFCEDEAPLTEVTVPNTLGSIVNDAPFAIGARPQTEGGAPFWPYAGMIDDVKVVKGEVLCQEDMTPPVLTCRVSPGYIWPLNQVMVQTFVTVIVSDSESGPARFELLSVTSNEADDDLFDGDRNDDIQNWEPGSSDTRGTLRAERSNSSATRIYTLTYEGYDVAGNSSQCTLQVLATHERPRDLPNSHLDDGYPLEIDPYKLR